MNSTLLMALFAPTLRRGPLEIPLEKFPWRAALTPLWPMNYRELVMDQDSPVVTKAGQGVRRGREQGGAARGRQLSPHLLPFPIKGSGCLSFAPVQSAR